MLGWTFVGKKACRGIQRDVLRMVGVPTSTAVCISTLHSSM